MAKKTYNGTDRVEWPSNPIFEIPNGAPELTNFLETRDNVVPIALGLKWSGTNMRRRSSHELGMSFFYFQIILWRFCGYA